LSIRKASGVAVARARSLLGAEGLWVVYERRGLVDISAAGEVPPQESRTP